SDINMYPDHPPLEEEPDAGLELEIVYLGILHDRDTNLKRRDDRPGQQLAHHEVERKEPPPGIAGALGGKVVADVAARVEVHEPPVRQRNVDQGASCSSRMWRRSLSPAKS